MPQNNENKSVSVADGTKKKRGRPPKNKGNVTNESQERISMTSDNENNKKIELGNNQAILSVDQVQQRWASIFNKYANYDIAGIQNIWRKNNYGMLTNPFVQNQRIRQISAQGRKISKSDLSNAIENPESNEMLLQSASWGLFYQNYVYQNIIKLKRDVPKYNWYVTPSGLTEKEIDSDAFRKEYSKVNKIVKKFAPNLTLKTIGEQVQTEGKASYFSRISYDKDDINFWVMQKLNSPEVKVTGFGSDQRLLIMFNLCIFLNPAYSVDQYPQYIKDAWNNLVNSEIIQEDKKGKLKFNPKAEIPENDIVEWNGNSWAYWVVIPQTLAWTFYTSSHTLIIPDLIGLFPEISSISDYAWLQSQILSKPVNSILTAEAEFSKEAKVGGDSTLLSPDTLLGYQDLAQDSLSANILPFFAPLKNFQMHEIPYQPAASELVIDRLKDVITSAGMASLISVSERPSIAEIKGAQTLISSNVDYLTRQFEEYINYMLQNEFELKYHWEVHLWGDIYSNMDEVKVLKELVVSGCSNLLPKMLSGLGITLEDYATMGSMMKAYGVEIVKDENKFAAKETEKNNKLNLENKLETIKVKDEKTDATTPSPGRPALNDSDVENDNTGAAKSTGGNVSDIKEFVAKLEDGDLEAHELLESIIENFDESFETPVPSTNTAMGANANSSSENVN